MADRELEELRAEAEELGVAVDGRWGADRLREEIDKALDAEEASGAVDQADEAETVDEPKGDGKRAGGWVNRDDGAGWVLEDGD